MWPERAHGLRPSCIDLLGVAFVNGASESHGLPHHQVILSWTSDDG